MNELWRYQTSFVVTHNVAGGGILRARPMLYVRMGSRKAATALVKALGVGRVKSGTARFEGDAGITFLRSQHAPQHVLWAYTSLLAAYRRIEPKSRRAEFRAQFELELQPTPDPT